MTPQIAKELLPIVKAFNEGKTIQFLDNNDNKWKDIKCPFFDDEPFKYRIKPEPKYRPFKSIEECWNEMQKHQPFGWVKYGESICNIQNITSDSITIIDYEEIYFLRFYESFMNLTFIDGTSFGIKEYYNC